MYRTQTSTLEAVKQILLHVDASLVFFFCFFFLQCALTLHKIRCWPSVLGEKQLTKLYRPVRSKSYQLIQPPPPPTLHPFPQKERGLIPITIVDVPKILTIIQSVDVALYNWWPPRSRGSNWDRGGQLNLKSRPSMPVRRSGALSDNVLPGGSLLRSLVMRNILGAVTVWKRRWNMFKAKLLDTEWQTVLEKHAFWRWSRFFQDIIEN